MNTPKHVYKSIPLDKNGCAHYSTEEQETWLFLLNRQNELVKNRASIEYLKGIELLKFGNQIPQHFEITDRLKSHTGWGVEPVAALIQPEEFFTLLSKKRFPAANFIRTKADIDYIQEPDVFHEFYGHCPLLTNAAYAEFMHAYGNLALIADRKTQMRMFRLFWFTIEFGLIKENNKMKAYGGGILSSKSEIIYSVESEIPERRILDPMEALRTPFRIDILQPVYFVINSYDDLFKLISKDPFKMAQESMLLSDFPAKFERKTEKKLDKSQKAS
ncbi:MAG: phenylalanine 4-monooxygenase [Bdellovibrionales bacterium]|nr:phenylalanine 4-monooxygenase [Bdellovibrionales bacterium]